MWKRLDRVLKTWPIGVVWLKMIIWWWPLAAVATFVIAFTKQYLSHSWEKNFPFQLYCNWQKWWKQQQSRFNREDVRKNIYLRFCPLVVLRDANEAKAGSLPYFEADQRYFLRRIKDTLSCGSKICFEADQRYVLRRIKDMWEQKRSRWDMITMMGSQLHFPATTCMILILTLILMLISSQR